MGRRVHNAAATVPPLRAQDASITMRKISRNGEEIPAVGLGTLLTFDALPGQPSDHMREVLRRFWDGRGRLVDTSPLYGTTEVSVGDFATAVGIGSQPLVTNRSGSTGEFLWRDRLNAMQIPSLVSADVLQRVLRGWKQEDRIRHLGVTHHGVGFFEPMAQLVERGDLDVVQLHYSIRTRQAEGWILRAAADRGTAVLVNMPSEKARRLKLVEN